MASMIVAQLRRRAGRAVALLMGVLLATTGFTVLTGSTATSQLTVQGEVNAHARGAYDILVRPKGSRTALEDQRGLVQANFLSGLYGGITKDQWTQVAGISGVEVAAPIAMLGYGKTLSAVEVDVTDLVDRSLETQLIRVHPTWQADRGLTNAVDVESSAVYVTKRPLISIGPGPTSEPPYPYEDGKPRPTGVCKNNADPLFQPEYEVQPDGSERPICLQWNGGNNSADPSRRSSTSVVRLTSRGTFEGFNTESSRLLVAVYVPMALLMAAIDPASEAALVGLDKAIVGGRYLRQSDVSTQYNSKSASVLMSNKSYLDENLSTVADVVADPHLSGKSMAQVVRVVQDAPATRRAAAQTWPVGDIYRHDVEQGVAGAGSSSAMSIETDPAVQAGQVRFDTLPDGTLRPHDVSTVMSIRVTHEAHSPLPMLGSDTAQRPTSYSLLELVKDWPTFGAEVGVFDPSKLSTGDSLSTSMETYTQPGARGADERSRGLLGGQMLQPNSNAGGYLATPPTVLMALNTLWEAGAQPDSISAIRVRVAGVTGFDDLSRERVRLAAESIAAATGLDVEVMLGASGAPQRIDLGPGKFGRPELILAELWSKKGVAAVIVRAIDRKSLILFGLILVVCLLFLANAITAAVRDRRRELAILSCLGWSRRHLAGLVVGETALIGLAAGVLSALLAWPLGKILDVHISYGHAWLAVPVAIGLCTVSAVMPAWRASRAHPGEAIHRTSGKLGRRGGRRRRRILGLALANLRRTPGRTALGVVALAVGIGGLTLVAAITWSFHGTVTGTLLGDAVSLRVRGVDILAVVATVLLGAFAVADVLYLNVRDRAAEFAALHATGWSGAALGRLITYEGLGIGVIGALLGAGLGLGSAVGFVGELSPGLLWTAGVTAGVGMALAAVAAIVPATLQRRAPMSALLAEE